MLQCVEDTKQVFVQKADVPSLQEGPGFVCMQEARFKHCLFEGECDFSSLDV